MNNFEINDIFSYIKEEYLTEAETDNIEKKNAKTVILPLAACFALILTGTVVYQNINNDDIKSVTKIALEYEDKTEAAGGIASANKSDVPSSAPPETSGEFAVGYSNPTNETETIHQPSTVSSGEPSSEAPLTVTEKPTEIIAGTETSDETASEIPATQPANDVTVPPTEPYTNGGNSGFCIFSPPFDTSIYTVGEKITDEEAADYLTKKIDEIKSALTQSGTSCRNLSFASKGYSCVSWTGTEGEKIEIHENHKNYYAYEGGEIIAIVSLAKENGELSHSLTYGEPWLEILSHYVNAHKGEALLYISSGGTELIVTPDNTVFCAALARAGYDAGLYLAAFENPYETLWHDDAVFTPQ